MEGYTQARHIQLPNAKMTTAPGSVCDVTVAAPFFTTVCGVESLRRNQHQVTKLSATVKQPFIFISF